MKSSRPTWIKIDLSAIKYNINSIKNKLSSGTKILAVVKTNAYGHGIVEVANTVVKEGVEFLGVTSVEEGILLRKKNIDVPILILGTLYPFGSFKQTIRHNLTPTIASLDGLKQLDKCSKKYNQISSFHLEIDTGMGRTGIAPESVDDFVRRLGEHNSVKLDGIYTHFASADSDDKYTKYQINSFNKVISKLKNCGYTDIIFHAANSAAIFKYPEAYYTMVRPGICIYGLLPFPESTKMINTKPALSWKTRIVYIKKVHAGKGISYGNAFVTKKDSVIATLPVGYGDGYSRLLSNKGYVLVKNRKVNVIGRVTMDMVMIDITDIPDVKVGDEVILIGSSDNEHITAEEFASLINTINYEVVCNIHPRVERIYKNG